MVFLALIIFVIVLGIYLFDAHNITKIEQYFQAQHCAPYYLYKGQYTGVCQGEIIGIKSGFSPQIQNPELRIAYRDIANISKIIKPKTNTSLAFFALHLYKTDGTMVILEFENEVSLETFQRKLRKH